MLHGYDPEAGEDALSHPIAGKLRTRPSQATGPCHSPPADDLLLGSDDALGLFAFVYLLPLAVKSCEVLMALTLLFSPLLVRY